MTYPTWPASLPRPERSSYQSTPQEVRLKKRSDAGPPGYRRRFTSASRDVSLSILVNRQGKAVFEEFFEQATGRGTVLFFMPDPTTDGWSLLDNNGAPVLDGAGNRILMSKRWLCTFGDGLPAETVIGTEFRFTFNIVVMP